MMVSSARVLYIAHYCRPNDAAWISTAYLLKALKLTDVVEKSFVITNDPGAARLGDVDGLSGWMEIRRMPFPSALDAKEFGKLLRATIAYFLVFMAALRVVREEGITHVFTQHHNYHMASFVGSLVARLLGRPCIIKVQDGIPYIGRFPSEAFLNRSIMAAFNKLAFGWAAFVLNKSPERAFLISRAFRIHRAKMLIVPNLVDLRAFSKHDEFFKKIFKERYGLDDRKVLLFVGSTAGRGLEKLVRALPHIASKIGKVKLVILGEAPDEGGLMDLATSLGVRELLVFAKPVEHALIPSVISLADLCIGPMTVGWFSLADVQRKILEYMACGKPFVVARWAVSRDLLMGGATGTAVDDPDDANELAEKIIRILADDERREEMGKNARKVIETFYDCHSPEIIKRLKMALLSSVRG